MVQLIEAAFPVLTLRYHPVLREFQRLGRELIGSYPSCLAGPNQTAVLQHIQVLGERRQRHRERSRQLAHRGRAATQPLQDRSSCRVGEGLKNTIELYGWVSHRPDYKPSPTLRSI